MPFEYSDFLINPYALIPPSFQPTERMFSDGQRGMIMVNTTEVMQAVAAPATMINEDA